jgi:hypothetical protein
VGTRLEVTSQGHPKKTQGVTESVAERSADILVGRSLDPVTRADKNACLCDGRQVGAPFPTITPQNKVTCAPAFQLVKIDIANADVIVV